MFKKLFNEKHLHTTVDNYQIDNISLTLQSTSIVQQIKFIYNTLLSKTLF